MTGHKQGPKQPVSKPLLGRRKYCLVPEESDWAAPSPTQKNAKPSRIPEAKMRTLKPASRADGARSKGGATAASIRVPDYRQDTQLPTGRKPSSSAVTRPAPQTLAPPASGTCAT